MLAAAAIPVGVASATTPLKVTCTSLTGSATSQCLTHCTGTGAIAADAGASPAHGTNVVSTQDDHLGERQDLQDDLHVHLGDQQLPGAYGLHEGRQVPRVWARQHGHGRRHRSWNARRDVHGVCVRVHEDRGSS